MSPFGRRWTSAAPPRNADAPPATTRPREARYRSRTACPSDARRSVDRCSGSQPRAGAHEVEIGDLAIASDTTRWAGHRRRLLEPNERDIGASTRHIPRAGERSHAGRRVRARHELWRAATRWHAPGGAPPREHDLVRIAPAVSAVRRVGKRERRAALRRDLPEPSSCDVEQVRAVRREGRRRRRIRTMQRRNATRPSGVLEARCLSRSRPRRVPVGDHPGYCTARPLPAMLGCRDEHGDFWYAPRHREPRERGDRTMAPAPPAKHPGGADDGAPDDGPCRPHRPECADRSRAHESRFRFSRGESSGTSACAPVSARENTRRGEPIAGSLASDRAIAASTWQRHLSPSLERSPAGP